MAVITIQIADEDQSLIEQLVKRLNAKILKNDGLSGEESINADTINAIEEARKGNVKKMDNIDEFFKNL